VSHIWEIEDAEDAHGDEGYATLLYICYTFVYPSSPFASPASPISWICDTSRHSDEILVLMCDLGRGTSDLSFKI
jgi:hypothetical protein